MGLCSPCPTERSALSGKEGATGHGSVGFRTCRVSVFQHILHLLEGPQARFRREDTSSGKMPPTRTLAPTHADQRQVGMVGLPHGIPIFPCPGMSPGVHKG